MIYKPWSLEMYEGFVASSPISFGNTEGFRISVSRVGAANLGCRAYQAQCMNSQRPAL